MSRLATPISVLAIAGASIALVACGSSGDDSAGGSASTNAGGGNGTQNAAFEKYRQCLKDNGVTLPDRGNGGPGGGQGGYGPPPGTSTDGTPPTGTNGTPPAGGPPSGGGGGAGGPGVGGQMDAKTQKAMQACAKLRPQGSFRGGYGQGNGGQRPQQDIKAFTPYLTCLKSAGLDVKVSDGFNALRNLKQDDPKVQAAFKSCQSKLPQRPNGNQQPSSATPGSTT